MMEKENVRKCNLFQIIPILFIVLSTALMVLSVTFNVLNKNERFIRYFDTYFFYKLFNKPIEKDGREFNNKVIEILGFEIEDRKNHKTFTSDGQVKDINKEEMER